MDSTALDQESVTLLEGICSSCTEIQQSLREHLETTSNPEYKRHIETDIVTLENLKLITVAIRTDIASGKIGASTELLLRIAANDFNNKLARIPEKKALRAEMSRALKEVHRAVLRLTAGPPQEAKRHSP